MQRSAPHGMPGQGMPGQAPRSGFRAALEVFKYRNFRYLWFSSFFSFTGMQMQQVARALLAWELTQSYKSVGLVSLSFGLPMLLFSLVGGSLADRFEKRNLTIASQAATGILAIINALMLTTNTITIEWLFVLGLGGGTAMALGMPARTPLMAQAVGPQNMMSAMAMSNAAMNATRLFGPAVAGGMIAVWTLESVYYLQAILYMFSCAMLFFVPTGLGKVAGMPGRPQGNMFKEIGAGLKYVFTDPRLRLLNMMMFAVSFFAMPYVMLLAGFVKEELERGDGAFGVLQSASGIGALVGSLAIAGMAAYDRKAMLQWFSGVTGALSLIGLAVLSHYWGYAGAVLAVIVLGLAMTAYQTLNSTMIMDAARPEFYGRVMSINMLTFSAMPLMAYPLGELADRIGSPETFVGQGLVVLGFMLAVAVINPKHTFGRVAVRMREERGMGGNAPGSVPGGPTPAASQE